MKEKPLNYRQSLFVKYYTDGETKGNGTASALKAGYKWKYANLACKFLLGNIRVKVAIEAVGVIIEAQDKNSREFVTKEFMSQYAQNKDKRPLEAIRVLENLGKNCGWFAEDNAQQRDKAELTAKDEEIADVFAELSLKYPNTPVLELLQRLLDNPFTAKESA